MTSQVLSSEANVELVRASFQAFNVDDIDACLARLAPDFVINLAQLPEPMYGRDVWRQGVEVMKHGFPDLQAHIEDIFATEDRVAVRLRFRGTHSGEFQGFPRPAAASSTSATSSTASWTASSSKSGSARTWRLFSDNSADG